MSFDGGRPLLESSVRLPRKILLQRNTDCVISGATGVDLTSEREGCVCGQGDGWKKKRQKEDRCHASWLI
jgi:hypothetical protein